MTRHFLDGDAQPRFTAARIEVIAAIGRLAEANDCSFVVVCGDVFETNHVSRQVVLRAFEAMRGTPGVTFYLLPGNHDPLDASSVFTSPTFLANRPANVVVLDVAGSLPIAEGVELVAAPWRNKHPLTDLVADAMAKVDSVGPTRIVVGHGAVDLGAPDQANPALVQVAALEAALGAGAIAYVALGDRHSTTSVGTSGKIWYSGAPEPTDYVEIDPGNVLLVEIDDAHTQVTPQHVGTWRFALHHADLTSSTDLDALEAWLTALDDKSRTIVKVALRGQISVDDSVRLETLIDHHRDLLAALEHWERHTDLIVQPCDADLDRLDVAGFAADALDELRTQSVGTSPEARRAVDAIALLTRLVGAPQ